MPGNLFQLVLRPESAKHAMVLIGACAMVMACARPLTVVLAPFQQPAPVGQTIAPNVVNAAGVADSTPPVVVLRYYAHAPTVSVVAWDPGRSAYGLRATVRRDGTLAFDHQLYISAYHFVELAAYFRADWNFLAPALKNPKRLLYTGMHLDVHACEGDDGDIGCSPLVTLQARIPDEWLRSGTDDVTVRIVGRGYNELTVTLRRAMIDAYLKKVDAVSNAIIAN